MFKSLWLNRKKLTKNLPNQTVLNLIDYHRTKNVQKNEQLIEKNKNSFLDLNKTILKIIEF